MVEVVLVVVVEVVVVLGMNVALCEGGRWLGIKKIGHHLNMTTFHRQTQNMSDLTSDRMPCFEAKRLGASLGLGHKVEISQL